MRFDIITIFPSIFDPYLEESLIKKATDKKLLEINVHDLRKWTSDHQNSVDDAPFGGGRGMVMKVEPIYKAVEEVRANGISSKVILFTPRGKTFRQKKATEFANFDQIIMICGRYEGVDERVRKYIADEEISIGSYVLMGGEIPAMAVIESVSRLVPGVVGKEEFLGERKKKEGFLEYPQYTRPEKFSLKGKERRVPPVLLSGNHEKIKKWRDRQGKMIK